MSKVLLSTISIIRLRKGSNLAHNLLVFHQLLSFFLTIKLIYHLPYREIMCERVRSYGGNLPERLPNVVFDSDFTPRMALNSMKDDRSLSIDLRFYLTWNLICIYYYEYLSNGSARKRDELTTNQGYFLIEQAIELEEKTTCIKGLKMDMCSCKCEGCDDELYQITGYTAEDSVCYSHGLGYRA